MGDLGRGTGGEGDGCTTGGRASGAVGCTGNEEEGKGTVELAADCIGAEDEGGAEDAVARSADGGWAAALGRRRGPKETRGMSIGGRVKDELAEEVRVSSDDECGCRLAGRDGLDDAEPFRRMETGGGGGCCC